MIKENQNKLAMAVMISYFTNPVHYISKMNVSKEVGSLSGILANIDGFTIDTELITETKIDHTENCIICNGGKFKISLDPEKHNDRNLDSVFLDEKEALKYVSQLNTETIENLKMKIKGYSKAVDMISVMEEKHAKVLSKMND